MTSYNGASSTALSAFTNSHVKALLKLAAQSPKRPDDPHVNDRVAKVEQLLAECAATHGTPRAGLLEHAALWTTSLDELRQLKNLAKIFFNDAADNRHKNAALLLYHVAGAAALSRHGVDISNQPWAERRLLYKRLEASFGTRSIGEIFRQALDAAPSEVR
jgi:hypothetical protein